MPKINCFNSAVSFINRRTNIRIVRGYTNKNQDTRNLVSSAIKMFQPRVDKIVSELEVAQENIVGALDITNSIKIAYFELFRFALGYRGFNRAMNGINFLFLAKAEEWRKEYKTYKEDFILKMTEAISDDLQLSCFFLDQDNYRVEHISYVDVVDILNSSYGYLNRAAMFLFSAGGIGLFSYLSAKNVESIYPTILLGLSSFSSLLGFGLNIYRHSQIRACSKIFSRNN